MVRRAGCAIALGLASFGLSRWFWSFSRPAASDFYLVHSGATAWLAGLDPYAVVGPGKPFNWGFPLAYPFTAVLAAIPFSFFPFQFAQSLFAACGAALFGWSIQRDRQWRFAWYAVPSLALVVAVVYAQWSTWLVTAALVPGWGALLACKPTIGAAMWAISMSRRTLAGAAAFLALSLVLLPSWPASWLATLASVSHMKAPVQYWGGPLLLLALLKWRRAEARMLGALALVPQTAVVYEALPLFLIPRSHPQAIALCLLTWFIPTDNPVTSGPAYDAWMQNSGQLIVYLLYLPCLAMVLTRPHDPAVEYGAIDDLSWLRRWRKARVRSRAVRSGEAPAALE